MIFTGCKDPDNTTPAPGIISLPAVTPIPPENAPEALSNEAMREPACTVISRDGNSI